MTRKAEISKEVLEKVIDDFRDDPVDLLGINDADGELKYLNDHKDEYLRTIEDINLLFYQDNVAKKILEIGPFLGAVSNSLAELGFAVTVADIPEFISCPRLQKKFKKYGINYFACNLRDYSLPFADDEFDAIIMCETLEHLNFNPLPVIKEINRILKSGGFLYLSLPNIAHFSNRIKLMQGKSIHNPISDFYAQLDPKDNMIVGLHWREYTAAEIEEMLESLGFAVKSCKYEPENKPNGRGLKRVVKRTLTFILNLRPIKKIIYTCLFDSENDNSLKLTQVTTAVKTQTSQHKFHFTDATRPQN